MSLSHYHSHIQPLEKQPCLFWEHTHTQKGREIAISSPRCGLAGDQLTGVTTKPDRAHVCVLVDSGCAEQVKSPPLRHQRDGKHREHAQVTLYFQQRWTLDREQTAGQRTGESCPPASLAIQNPGI